MHASASTTSGAQAWLRQSGCACLSEVQHAWWGLHLEVLVLLLEAQAVARLPPVVQLPEQASRPLVQQRCQIAVDLHHHKLSACMPHSLLRMLLICSFSSSCVRSKGSRCREGADEHTAMQIPSRFQASHDHPTSFP